MLQEVCVSHEEAERGSADTPLQVLSSNGEGTAAGIRNAAGHFAGDRASDDRSAGEEATEASPLFGRRGRTSLTAYRSVVSFLARDFVHHLSDKTPKYIKNYTAGFVFLLNKVWSPAFYFMLLYDVIAYLANPRDRYGTTLGQILGGVATNQITLTSNLGNDLAGTALYSVGPAIVGAGVSFGALFWLNKKFRNAVNALWQQIPGVPAYEKWKNEETSPRPIVKDSLMVITLGVFYANERLLELWIRKIIGLKQYADARQACTSQNKKYIFLGDYGNYECALVDWPFVADYQKLSSQEAFDGLLEYSQDPEFILSKLPDLSGFFNLTQLDLSSLNWPEWSLEQWREFLLALSEIFSLKTVNASAASSNQTFPQDGRFKLLVDFVERVNAQVFDAHNQQIGTADTAELSRVFSQFSEADVSSMGLNNTEFMVGRTQKLKKLKVGCNPLGNSGIQIIANEISNDASVLEEVVIPNTGMDEQGLAVLGNALPRGNVKKIDVSQHDFSQADMYAFGQSVGNSTVGDIDLSQTQLDGSQAVDFILGAQNGKVTSVDYSSNNLQDSAAIDIVEAAQGTSLQSVKLNNNPGITDVGAAGMAQGLNQTNITAVGLAGTDVTVTGVKTLISQPSLKSLDASNNNQGDEVASVLANTPHNVQDIKLANTGLTAKGVADLAVKNYTSVDVSNNGLRDGALNPLLNKLPEYANLGGNTMGPSSSKVLVENLPLTQNKDLDLREAKLSPDSATKILSALPQPTPDAEQIGSDLSIDEARALRQVGPGTKLKRLNLKGNNIGKSGQRAVDQVIPSLGNSPQILFSPPAPAIGGRTVSTNGAQLAAGLSMAWCIIPAALLLLLIYGIYRGYQGVRSCKK